MELFIGIIVVAILLFVVITYNRLVQFRNRVQNSWAQVDVYLKRRFDLIPNLVQTVKGFASHERTTLENVIQMRNKYVGLNNPNEKMLMNAQLTGMLTDLFALSESYPELKSNQNFLKLQEELEETENKIAFSRQFLNDTVQMYNDAILVFPSNIIAKIFKFEKESYFEVVSSEKENVEVNL